MFRIIIISLLAYVLCLSPIFSASAIAAVPWGYSSQELAHIQSALYYCEQQKWQDARFQAAAIKDPVLTQLVDWLRFRAKESGSSFQEITKFLQKNPHWPDRLLLQQRAEEAITSTIPNEVLLKWFEVYPPVSGDGFRFYAEAKANAHIKATGNTDPRHFPAMLKQLIRQGWIKGNFGQKEEQAYLTRFGTIITQKEHHERLDYLLWQGKISAAKRLLARAETPYHELFSARIQLNEGVGGDAAVSLVPAALKHDPGLLYDRLVWHERRQNGQGMLQLLHHLPQNRPYPEKWWEMIAPHIRDLLEEKEYQLAYKLASKHGMKEGANFAEAEWLAGWIALRFLKHPHQAYEHFYKIYYAVQYPISLARAAYWAGRAAEASGNQTIAADWYEQAAKHPDTFYGQLGVLKRHRNQWLVLPKAPVVTEKDHHHLQKNVLAKAAFFAVKLQDKWLARKFIQEAISESKTAGEKWLITSLGQQIGHPFLSIEAAKQSSREGALLIDKGYPRLMHFPQIGPEKALILAIIRQESSFDKMAISSAGAQGLMQLLPSTAKESARALNLNFSTSRLRSDGTYNVQLGSYYLKKLINYWQGSYILAIAAYNGGIGNVRKWVSLYGDPRHIRDIEQLVDWLEMLPFAETRNYVQRVLEATQIYRKLLGNTPKSLTLETDLHR